MALRRRSASALLLAALAALVGGTLGSVSPSAGQAGGPSGGAFGRYTTVALFGGPPGPNGPAPQVTLPSTGSATPVTATSPTGEVRYGPAVLFTSRQIEVSTQGTPGGTVTSSAKITDVNTSKQEVLTATGLSSTCNASPGAGPTGSTTITGGRLMTSEGNPDTEGDEIYVDVPANPEPNKTYEGKLESVGDTFRYVFNEQVVKDGSITVNAAHQYLGGPLALGEQILGQVRCAAGGTASAAPTASSSTSPPGQASSATSPTSAAPSAEPGEEGSSGSVLPLALGGGGALLAGAAGLAIWTRSRRRAG